MDRVGTLELVTEEVVDEEPEVHHGVHTRCQKGSAFVVTDCGIAMDWDEKDTPGEHVDCEICWTSKSCKLCGSVYYG